MSILDFRHIAWLEWINASVEDEAIQAVLGMNEKKSSPAQSFWFFSLFSAPKFFPLTYLPPT
jgi:hypothetical protein